jgi:hypothetical protein
VYRYLVGRTEVTGPHDRPGRRRKDRLCVGREVVNLTFGP